MKKIMIIALLALTFAAQGNAKDKLTVGVVADVQYARNTPDKKGRHYSLGVQRLTQAVECFNATEGLAFVVDLGDMTDRNYEDYADLKVVKDLLTVPCYNVFGNHDFKPAKTADEFARAAELKGLSKKSWYSFVKKGVRFIFLNSSDVATHSCPADSEEGKAAARYLKDMKDRKMPSAHSYNGALGLRQMQWLDGQLAAADRKGEYAIIFCHMPLTPLGLAETLWNNIEVLQLIESHPSAKAVICGHKHKGGYTERQGIHYVTMLGMVDGDNNRYSTLTVDKDAATITIDGFGDEVDRTLKCR